MKVIIAGSRDIWRIVHPKDAGAIVSEAIAESTFDIDTVISGGARGVDEIGEHWAREREIPVWRRRPNYAAYPPKQAPLMRNIDMGETADALIAIWDGQSTGTKHMISVMQKLGKPVFVRLIEHRANAV